MTRFVEVPHARVESELLQALLEEFASRDGTDYGAIERTLESKAGELRTQLSTGELCLLYDTAAEHWDLVPREQARDLLAG